MTVGQCAILLIDGSTATTANDERTSEWRKAYLQNLMKTVFAAEQLATQNQIFLSAAQQSQLAKHSKDTISLHTAVEGPQAEESWQWYLQSQALAEAVEIFYAKRYTGPIGPFMTVPNYTEAMVETMKTITLEPTAAYEAIDLQALRDRLLASGFYALHGIAPSNQWLFP